MKRSVSATTKISWWGTRIFENNSSHGDDTIFVTFSGNVTTLIAMCMVLGAILDPTEPFSDTWESYGELSTAPLFIGTILFAVESFGVVMHLIIRTLRTHVQQTMFKKSDCEGATLPDLFAMRSMDA